MVVHRLPKPSTRVRFPYAALIIIKIHMLVDNVIVNGTFMYNVTVNRASNLRKIYNVTVNRFDKCTM